LSWKSWARKRSDACRVPRTHAISVGRGGLLVYYDRSCRQRDAVLEHVARAATMAACHLPEVAQEFPKRTKDCSRISRAGPVEINVPAFLASDAAHMVSVRPIMSPEATAPTTQRNLRSCRAKVLLDRVTAQKPSVVLDANGLLSPRRVGAESISAWNILRIKLFVGGQS
jgi:hypothetical protein